MARGYLGKISAVISANTGDYVRKLNESAKETRAFASTVQNTLGRASKDAAQSLNGIFTPLQKVERALRAAASQKLAFRGFDGAIRDVQSLQAAIAKLTDQRTIDLVVKTSGVGSLEELKRTINVLRNQDVAVGVDGLRAQRAAQQAAGANFIGPVTLQVKQEGDRLDAVIEALERIDAERIKQISLQVEDAQLTAATTQFRRLTELSTQIGAPLAKAQSEFSGLAGTIQAQFIPALSRTQSAYEQFQQRIKEGADLAGSEFRGLADDVRVLEASIGRLRETSAAGGRLFSGEELTFVRPQVVDELNKLAAAQQKLAAAPAAARGSPIARDLLADAQILREQIERVSARIERLNSQGLDITVSQAGLDLAIRRLQEVRRLTEDIASPPQPPEIRIDVDLADVENSGRQLQAAFVDRIRAIDTAWEQAVRGLTGGTDDIDRRFFSLARTIESLGVGDRVDLDPAIAEFRNAVAAGEGYARQLELLAQLESRLGDVQAAAAMRGNATGFVGPPRPRTDLDPNYLRDIALSRASQSLGADAAAPQRALDSLRGSIVSIKGQLDTLPASLRSQFIPAIQGAEAEFRRLAITPRVTADQIESAAGRVDALTASVRRAADAARILNFGDVFSQASSRQAISELEAVQRVLLQVRATAGGGAAQAFDRLAERTRRAVQEGNAGLPRVRAELQRLQRAAAEAAAATGRISVGRALQQISRAGDVGRAGLDRFQLAAQQAGFALDDFFSVTGGVEQRLRAVSNNISQLGFIIGGTAGLFTALGVTIGTQLILAISKFAFKSDEGEAAAKALSDTLKNQRDRVKELSDAYKELANSIADSGLSEAGRRLSERSRSRQQRERQAGDIALNEFALRSPSFALSLGRERLAQEGVQNAGSLSGATAAVRAERQASAARAREERIARSRIRALADSTPISEIRRQRVETRDELARERARRSRSLAAAVFTAGISTFIPGFETNRNRENRLRERLATQEGAIALGRQRQAESFVQRGQRIGDRLAPFQENVRGFTETQGRIDRILTRFAETAQKVADGALSPGEIEAATNQLERLAAEAERVAISLQGLQGVLDRQVSQLADSFVSDLQNREEQLRRQANAAEARNDPAAAGLRRDEQDIIQARRRAEQQRQNIEEQISSERQRFEQELIAGRGNAEDRRRAEEIRAQREIIDSEKASQAEKERARLRLSQLELEQSQSFEQRASVQRLRDQANQGDIAAQREIQRIESRQRGRDLGLTELEQRRRELRQQAADIGEAFRSGDIGPGGVQAAARNMGGQLAPMLAQFRDEVLSARLQGPSRAALRVADINTAEGRSELNRLIRGEDSNRDVNLLELQNQSRLLQEIKVAIESETNMVVDL